MILRHNMAIQCFVILFLWNILIDYHHSVVVNVLQNSSSNLPEAFVIIYKINFQSHVLKNKLLILWIFELLYMHNTIFHNNILFCLFEKKKFKVYGPTLNIHRSLCQINGYILDVLRTLSNSIKNNRNNSCIPDNLESFNIKYNRNNCYLLEVLRSINVKIKKTHPKITDIFWYPQTIERQRQKKTSSRILDDEFEEITVIVRRS